jgi:hypothetical protein
MKPRQPGRLRPGANAGQIFILDDERIVRPHHPLTDLSPGGLFFIDLRAFSFDTSLWILRRLLCNR